MRKIEKLNDVTEDVRAVFMKTKPSEIMMWDKINELCDAINEMRGWLSGEAQDVLIAGGRSVSPKGSPDSVGSNPKPLTDKQTQEPECGCKELVYNGDPESRRCMKCMKKFHVRPL